MANEIKISASIEVTKNSAKAILTAASAALFTMSGTKFVHGVQSVGFAAKEALGMGEITTPGFACFINRDPTNFVNLFPDATGVGSVKLKPGEPALFRLSAAAAAPYAQADTAACLLEYCIAED